MAEMTGGDSVGNDKVGNDKVGQDKLQSEIGGNAEHSIVGSKDVRQQNGSSVGSGRQENYVSFSSDGSNVGFTGYTLYDLRTDIKFLKQEIDRLKDDLGNGRYVAREVNERIVKIEENIEFIEDQIRNALMVKAQPATTQVVPMWTLNVLIGLFILATVILLIFLARGHL